MSVWPFYSEEEIQAVSDVLRSGKVNYWTGEQGKLFEKEYAEYLGVKHAIAVANGTNALELCLIALGVGPGDEVLIPCRTFFATASCVVAVGARPVVCDVDLESQVITVETIKPHITPKTKAIIAVHLGGWPSDMEALAKFSKEHHLYLIEDCAQAHGARFNGKPVGSFGDMAAFSFCQDKIISTMGEGGLVATNNTEAWKKAWAYKDHGKSYDTVHRKDHPPGFRWVHESFGSNYRMTEAQAAIGRIQLRRLDHDILHRQRFARIFNDQLKNSPAVTTVIPPASVGHAYYRYYLFVNSSKLNPSWSREKIIAELNAAGVPCMIGGCSEIYREKAFVDAGLAPKENFANALQLAVTNIAFIPNPSMDEKEIYAAAKKTKEIVDRAV